MQMFMVVVLAVAGYVAGSKVSDVPDLAAQALLDRSAPCVCTSQFWACFRKSFNMRACSMARRECERSKCEVCNVKCPRVCRCRHGAAATGSSCLSNTAIICASCNLGYWLHGNACKMNECECTNGKAATGASCTAEGATGCTDCNPGFTLNFNGNLCQTNDCLCTGGVAARGVLCSSHGANVCVSCHEGFSLEGDACIQKEGSLADDVAKHDCRAIFIHCLHETKNSKMCRRAMKRCKP